MRESFVINYSVENADASQELHRRASKWADEQHRQPQPRSHAGWGFPTKHLSQSDQNQAGKQGPEGLEDAATRLRAAPRHPTGHDAL